MLLTCSGVADRPAMAAAGSPGIMWIMPKVIRLTMSMIGIALPSRRIRMPNMPCAQFANQTLDMRGMRNGTKPCTFARTACILV